MVLSPGKVQQQAMFPVTTALSSQINAILVAAAAAASVAIDTHY